VSYWSVGDDEDIVPVRIAFEADEVVVEDGSWETLSDPSTLCLEGSLQDLAPHGLSDPSVAASSTESDPSMPAAAQPPPHARRTSSTSRRTPKPLPAFPV
jgi:hypothetical protein